MFMSIHKWTIVEYFIFCASTVQIVVCLFVNSVAYQDLNTFHSCNLLPSYILCRFSYFCILLHLALASDFHNCTSKRNYEVNFRNFLLKVAVASYICCWGFLLQPFELLLRTNLCASAEFALQFVQLPKLNSLTHTLAYILRYFFAHSCGKVRMNRTRSYQISDGESFGLGCALAVTLSNQ